MSRRYFAVARPLRAGALRAALCGVVAASLVAAGHAWAQSADGEPRKELVAVLDVQPVQASEAEARALTDRLREVLLESGRFTLVDRSQMESVLDEQALQQTGCTSRECAVQVGRILGVRKLVAGNVVKVSDDAWLLSALIVDVETSETLRAASVRHQGTFFALMDDRVRELGDKLAGLAPAAVAPPPDMATAPARPSEAVPPKRVALFAPYVSGANSGIVEVRESLIASVVRVELPGQVPGVEVVYAYGADSTVKGIHDEAIEADSWQGFFGKEPNDAFVFRMARDMNVDFAVLYWVDTETRHRGTLTVYLYDLARQTRSHVKRKYGSTGGSSGMIQNDVLQAIGDALRAPAGG